MSFFKKIFGKSEPNKPGYAFTQRYPRVPLSPLHKISFRFVDSKTDRTLNLANISVGGMAVVHGGDSSLLGIFQDGQPIQGFVEIDSKEVAIQARVRHVSKLLAGCEFTDQSAALRKAVESYLRVEISALSLRPVDEMYLQADPRGQVSWFTDGKQNEVYCVTDDKGLAAFHMTFLGNYIEGSRGKPLSGGLVNEDEGGSDRQKGSSLLEMNSFFKPEMANLALTFIQNVERMSPETRKEIEKYIHDA